MGKKSHDQLTNEDEAQILALRPTILEQLQRHNIWRHLHHGLFQNEDLLFINHYYADAVYAPSATVTVRPDLLPTEGIGLAHGTANSSHPDRTLR